MATRISTMTLTKHTIMKKHRSRTMSFIVLVLLLLVVVPTIVVQAHLTELGYEDWITPSFTESDTKSMAIIPSFDITLEVQEQPNCVGGTLSDEQLDILRTTVEKYVGKVFKYYLGTQGTGGFIEAEFDLPTYTISSSSGTTSSGPTTTTPNSSSSNNTNNISNKIEVNDISDSDVTIEARNRIRPPNDRRSLTLVRGGRFSRTQYHRRSLFTTPSSQQEDTTTSEDEQVRLLQQQQQPNVLDITLNFGEGSALFQYGPAPSDEIQNAVLQKFLGNNDELRSLRNDIANEAISKNMAHLVCPKGSGSTEDHRGDINGIETSVGTLGATTLAEAEFVTMTVKTPTATSDGGTGNGGSPEDTTNGIVGFGNFTEQGTGSTPNFGGLNTGFGNDTTMSTNSVGGTSGSSNNGNTMTTASAGGSDVVTPEGSSKPWYATTAFVATVGIVGALLLFFVLVSSVWLIRTRQRRQRVSQIETQYDLAGGERGPRRKVFPTPPAAAAQEPQQNELHQYETPEDEFLKLQQQQQTYQQMNDNGGGGAENEYFYNPQQQDPMLDQGQTYQYHPEMLIPLDDGAAAETDQTQQQQAASPRQKSVLDLMQQPSSDDDDDSEFEQQQSGTDEESLQQQQHQQMQQFVPSLPSSQQQQQQENINNMFGEPTEDAFSAFASTASPRSHASASSDQQQQQHAHSAAALTPSSSRSPTDPTGERMLLRPATTAPVTPTASSAEEVHPRLLEPFDLMTDDETGDETESELSSAAPGKQPMGRRSLLPASPNTVLANMIAKHSNENKSAISTPASFVEQTTTTDDETKEESGSDDDHTNQQQQGGLSSSSSPSPTSLLRHASLDAYDVCAKSHYSSEDEYTEGEFSSKNGSNMGATKRDHETDTVADSAVAGTASAVTAAAVYGRPSSRASSSSSSSSRDRSSRPNNNSWQTTPMTSAASIPDEMKRSTQDLLGDIVPTTSSSSSIFQPSTTSSETATAAAVAPPPTTASSTLFATSNRTIDLGGDYISMMSDDSHTSGGTGDKTKTPPASASSSAAVPQRSSGSKKPSSINTNEQSTTSSKSTLLAALSPFSGSGTRKTASPTKDANDSFAATTDSNKKLSPSPAGLGIESFFPTSPEDVADAPSASGTTGDGPEAPMDAGAVGSSNVTSTSLNRLPSKRAAFGAAKANMIQGTSQSSGTTSSGANSRHHLLSQISFDTGTSAASLLSKRDLDTTPSSSTHQRMDDAIQKMNMVKQRHHMMLQPHSSRNFIGGGGASFRTSTTTLNQSLSSPPDVQVDNRPRGGGDELQSAEDAAYERMIRARRLRR